MKKETTEEQLEKFWKWCGLRWEKCHWDCPFSPDEHTQLYPKTNHIHLVYPDGSVELTTAGKHIPEPDLNNLFKWAVPKLRDFLVEKYGQDFPRATQLAIASEFALNASGLTRWLARSVEKPDGAALSLFWVIYEAAGLEVKGAKS